MTENTTNDSHTNDALAPSIDDIIRLENEVQALKNEIADYQIEKERIQIEAKLSIEDAQLARSFSRKNYTPLLDELFQQPAKRLRRQNIILFVLSLLCIGVLLGQNMYTQLFPNTPSPTLNKEITALDKKISALESVITTTHHTLSENHADLLHALQEKNAAKNNAVTPDSHTPPIENKIAPLAMSEKEKTIQQQAHKIRDYVQHAASQKGFPKDFTHNKTSLAQLYLIVMQHANKDKVYYESYLSAMRELNISEAIMPKNIDDLVQLDIDFLQATFSAFVITKHKQEKKWRYRESDQKFSSYYNPNLDYNLGPWQIVNNKKDYADLPKIFAVNIKRITDQLSHNKKTSALTIAGDIFYSPYDENNKNAALKKLLNTTTLPRERDMLAINTREIALPLNKSTIAKIQQTLADKGFMSPSVINGIAGPKTKKAIQNFQQSKGLNNDGKMSVGLLNSMGISPFYSNIL